MSRHQPHDTRHGRERTETKDHHQTQLSKGRHLQAIDDDERHAQERDVGEDVADEEGLEFLQRVRAGGVGMQVELLQVQTDADRSAPQKVEAPGRKQQRHQDQKEDIMSNLPLLGRDAGQALVEQGDRYLDQGDGGVVKDLAPHVGLKSAQSERGGGGTDQLSARGPGKGPRRWCTSR